MEYNIIKDKDTKDTIKNIKRILQENNIDVSENTLGSNEKKKNTNMYEPYSFRLNIHGEYSIGTNGKGTSYNNALASAYGELMERLQNFRFFFLDDLSCLKQENYKILDKENISKILSADALEFIKQNPNCRMFGFFSVKDKEVYGVPYETVLWKQASNGMAAGNTYEEAIVQGLSEICERYALKEIITQHITPPDIPQDLYIQYDNIRGLIECYNKCGYEVYLKDASLNKDLPVVLGIFKHKDSSNILFYLGSHPYLPIAIERTLTEFAQGFNITDLKDCNTHAVSRISSIVFSYYFKNDVDKIYSAVFNNRTVFEDNNYFEKQFFNSMPSYNFCSSAWVFNKEQLNNKALLKFLINNISKITEDIFIRNVSFLNFPAVYIVIPKMSYFIDANIKYQKFMRKIFSTINLIAMNRTEDIIFDPDDFGELLEYYSTCFYWKSLFALLDCFFARYLCFLISVYKRDLEKINKFADILINGKFEKRHFSSKDNLNQIKIIRDYFNFLAKNRTSDDIILKLNEMYGKNLVKPAMALINNLSPDVIKNLFIRRIKQNIESRPSSILSDDGIRKAEILKNRLCDIYNKNIPNQDVIKKIFKDIKL